jgi:acetyl esterase
MLCCSLLVSAKCSVFPPVSTVQYVWDAYLENTEEQLKIPTAAPMSADLELLQDTPPASIISAEADIFREHGETYSKKLNKAGLPAIAARYIDASHGFLRMPYLKKTQAPAALFQTAHTLKKHWQQSESKLMAFFA